MEVVTGHSTDVEHLLLANLDGASFEVSRDQILISLCLELSQHLEKIRFREISVFKAQQLNHQSSAMKVALNIKNTALVNGRLSYPMSRRANLLFGELARALRRSA